MTASLDLETPLKQAAHDLAAQHRLAGSSPEPIALLREVPRTKLWLKAVRQASVDPPPGAEKAAEWLLDNDYQVFRALQRIDEDLPMNFYRQLPALHSDQRRVPRIHAVAIAYLRVSHMQVSTASLATFVEAYQDHFPLNIAEIWALPTMLRVACIEQLMTSLVSLLPNLPDLPFQPNDACQETLSLDATERTARSISNLASVAAIPWDDFFDRVSLVEAILARDPTQHYAHMDFETRDRYRDAVEQLAQASSRDEIEIAEMVVQRARLSHDDRAESHVGYWLIDRGRAELERELGAALHMEQRLRRMVGRHPGKFYAIAILSSGLATMILPALYLALVGASLAGWIGAMLVSTVPASVLAITAVHWTITRVVPPTVLPKIDCREGLPRDAACIVAVPVLVCAAEEAADLGRQLETHWLANSDPGLQVALLADPADASSESTPQDEAIEEELARVIGDLNRLHGDGPSKGPFHLFLRSRRFNRSQGCWIAWERKRGKLEQFNRLLVEGDWGGFTRHIGNREALEDIRYVVTVDADTMLPPGAVARLVGTLSHPLNRARFDPGTGKVERGYALIQPRVEISPQAGNRSLFTRLFTGDTAIDIYSRAVSDVYQDLFGEGIFVGKGIYDVYAFHAAVDGRVPENRILSHDLFEGAHGRAALATDIVLYEGFPTSYPEYARRLHRWIRGDWQLLAWLWPRVPGPDGTRLISRISGIDRWKMLDNLRRSLVAPGLVLMAIAGWFVLPGNPLFWTALVILAPGWQLMTDIVSGMARGRRLGATFGLRAQLADQTGRWLQLIVYLMNEAVLSLHAIVITLWRTFVSGRNMLEWTAAAHVASRMAQQSARILVWREMWLGSVLAAVIGVMLAVLRPSALPVALPLLAVWLAAPEIALISGRPRQSQARPLDEGDSNFLRLLARRTWYFFERFAGPEDNWLPPDNYQGPPHEEIGHRTSPTNIGMLLVSTAAAWDLGFLGRAELLARGSNVLDALDQLERYRGHFYNWYDTRHLRPLEPRYVSTVDSGNLAVSLIAYAETLRQAASGVGIEAQRWQGLDDVFELLDQAATDIPETADLRALVSAIRSRAKVVAATGEEAEHAACIHRMRDRELLELAECAEAIVDAVGEEATERMGDMLVWLDRLRHHVDEMHRDLEPQAAQAGALHALAEKAVALAWSMDFSWLYDRDRRLFYIGHNVTASRLDTHHYDLLASEARLASYFAIAKRDVPIDHWFHLQRPVTRAQGGLSLVSWNGSMFEYLMPRLLLRGEPETLLGESERVSVAIQQRHARSLDIPWGVSESAYAERDPEHRYRYQAFGTPGLGLKRGLARDQVVSPYASALALAVAPAEATANLRKLSDLGAQGRYGMWEALDFTPERAPASQRFMPVVAYMAHHQGMILCAITNALMADRMVHRFLRNPQMKLVSLLLSERVPNEIPPEIERLETITEGAAVVDAASIGPWTPEATPFPQMHVLGNGRLSSWIGESGAGVLRWQGQGLTRFAPDATREADGIWLYLVDLDSANLWSATRQPTGAIPDEYRVQFQPHCAEFHRRDDGIDLRQEVCVGSGEDIEIRRVTLINETARVRRLRLTSYAEVVLARPVEDERHPAFSKLFVAGHHVPRMGGLLFTRTPRSASETPAAMVQFAIDENGPIEGLCYETDRRGFIGRGRTLEAPLGASRNLSGTSGFTLDPVSALQWEVVLRPGEMKVMCLVTAVAASASSALEVAERHATLAAMEWIFGDAALEASRTVARCKLAGSDLPLVQTLGSLMILPHGTLRAEPARIRENRLGQSSLWGLALSGDLPILLLRVNRGNEALLPLLASAHELWRRTGLPVDLVILQNTGSAYVEPLRGELIELLRDMGATDMLGRNGGIHLLFADQSGADQVRMLEAVAWAILDDTAGSLGQQIAATRHPGLMPPPILPTLPQNGSAPADPSEDAGQAAAKVLGSFSPDGREYVIRLGPGQTTPAPWSNVLANDDFGTLVTETGGGFTWSINSGENRLTPWTNDPVCDPPSEALYLRDEETVAIWTVTPGPSGQHGACEVTHGLGYSDWRRNSHGLEQSQRVFAAPDAPVKLIRLRLHNRTDRNRRLTATYYAEWLLGSLPSVSRRHVRCRFDESAQVLLASNPWNADFAERSAFLSATVGAHSFTTDREEFLGREGRYAEPEGLRRWGLAGTQVAGPDACGAYQVHLDLAPGESQEVTFLLGQGESEAQAVALAKKWKDPATIASAESALAGKWEERLGAVQVETPDPVFDTMINHWLIYQSLSSRIMARVGFYQASGAIGFRDQLQDVLALLPSDPARTRAHILTCAAHQFEEGDVLHWWHPPADRGVRTRFSDDLLWLPYAAGTYVRATGDAAILEESVPFLSAPPLGQQENDRYAQFPVSGTSASLIEHCERALERVSLGAHGLPLMGTGDWNDGMDRVGDHGRGESVWLAWFASVAASMLSDLEARLDRVHQSEHWSRLAGEWRRNAEDAGWDGSWYRRAYDDEGHPLGSARNEECRIDSISQSWAVFAGADRQRTARAIESARGELIDREAGLARLLWPPFDRSAIDPGYIAAYPPGLRENGGQYSHAAAWLGLALAQSGEPEEALEIFHMICPGRRTASSEGTEHYRIEPYVIAGDIASAHPHRGKGGWSWYTGAAAWTWRLGVEGLLGLTLEDGKLRVAPSLPADWPGYRAVMRRGDAKIVVEVSRHREGRELTIVVDGEDFAGDAIAFPAEGMTRHVLVRCGAAQREPVGEPT
uniref:GH36-type glycosyl hydrolase domain-containing protein n=1 Tax=Parerythrobacter lutipelagi TaxID=1964208 RepID=UPI0010F9A436|nr:glucoamylase family protein [Parerythrobacter lutipelagi]